MELSTFLQKTQLYAYYIIIGVLSLVVVFFFPFVGSTIGFTFTWPTTTSGWIVFVVSKLCVALINILIFHLFILQAKVNVKDNPAYKAAVDKLAVTKKSYVPLSPAQFFAREYGFKGISVFVLSMVSAIGLTQAVLTFDLIMMLTYLFTILMGITAGYMEMRKVEEFWTEEFPEYADYKIKHGGKE